MSEPAKLKALAEAVVAAEIAYNAACDKQERRRLAVVSRDADAALEKALGTGIDSALIVLALIRGIEE